MFGSFSLDIPALPVVALVAVTLFLCLLYPNRSIWVDARPELPGPTGLPLIGNLLNVLPWRDSILGFIGHMLNEYGPLCTFTMPAWGRVILINRPEWLAHVKQADNHKYTRGPIALSIFKQFPGNGSPVASEGAAWRMARKTMFPIFSIRSFTDHVSRAMNEIVPLTRTLLLAASNEKLILDWNDLAGRIALAIFCKSALNIDTTTLRADIGCLQDSDSLRDALTILNGLSSKRLFNPFWTWTEMIDGSGRRFRDARAQVWEVVDTIIKQRQKDNLGKKDLEETDFLSSLMKETSENSDPLRLRDTLVTLVFAGRDNIQNSLGWSLSALLKHPEWMERMRTESIANMTHQEVLYSDIKKYDVHLAVFYETVRMWPGLPKNARLAVEDDVLPPLPEHNLPEVKVSKGDYIFWSDFHMMRSEEVWGPDAKVFNPGRHLDSNGKFVKPGAPIFNGFGAGPRLCPAAQLAAYEFVACWAGILPYFEFHNHGGEEPQVMEALTVSISGSLMIEVRAREFKI